MPSGDVVDDGGARVRRPPGGLGVIGVHRDAYRGVGQSADHRPDPVPFVPGGQRRGAGPGRFAADVDDVGPLADHAIGPFDGRVGVDVQAAVGERIRRDVEDPHDEAPAGGAVADMLHVPFLPR